LLLSYSQEPILNMHAIHDELKYDEAEELMLLARGDEQAYAKLYNRYKNRVFTTALRYLKERELAQEVVQDTFLKVWELRASFAQVKNAEAYIFTMARNRTLTQLKKITTDQSAQFQYTVVFSRREVAGGQELLEKENDRLLDETLGMLTPQQRKVYAMSREEGLSHQAIAERLNISTNTVNNHIKDSLKVMRRRLQPYIGISVLPVLLGLFCR
jgi:RNA polymerase sigma-70 factor (family 1)